MSKRRISLVMMMMLLITSLSYANGQETIPYRVEVAFIKTIHISFPSKINYVDLGSNYIIAGKADGAENVLRVKAAVRGFSEQTNFSVICEDGSFWLFQADYAEQPTQQYYEMKSMHALLAEERPTNIQEVQLSDINGESPVMLDLIMKSLYQENKREIKNIGQRKGRIEATVKGIYVHNDILYLHLNFKNKSNVSYDIDYMKFCIADRKRLKKQASQELPLYTVREFNGNVPAKIVVASQYHTIIAFNKFTISPDKKMVMSIVEKNGGRHISFDISPADIINAKSIKNIIL